jgi:hypothetical protein
MIIYSFENINIDKTKYPSFVFDVFDFTLIDEYKNNNKFILFSKEDIDKMTSEELNQFKNQEYTVFILVKKLSDKNFLFKNMTYEAVFYSDDSEVVYEINLEMMNRYQFNFINRTKYIKNSILTYQNKKINLTKNEETLLLKYLKNNRVIYSFEELSKALNISVESLRKVISRLNLKIAKAVNSNNYIIENIKGVGYRLTL